MNRDQFKFRIWCHPTKAYIYSKSFWVYKQIPYFLEKPKRYSVEQFTGLFDKNGKEIYENDILAEECDHDKDYTGEELTYTRRSQVMRMNGYFSHSEDKFDLIMNADKRGVNNYVEVVGNVWENANLLRN